MAREIKTVSGMSFVVLTREERAALAALIDVHQSNRDETEDLDGSLACRQAYQEFAGPLFAADVEARVVAALASVESGGPVLDWELPFDTVQMVANAAVEYGV